METLAKDSIVLTGPLPAISTAPRLLRKPCSPQTHPAAKQRKHFNWLHFNGFAWQFLTRYTVNGRIQKRKQAICFKIAPEIQSNKN